jgi:hypothetical protein
MLKMDLKKASDFGKQRIDRDGERSSHSGREVVPFLSPEIE